MQNSLALELLLTSRPPSSLDLPSLWLRVVIAVANLEQTRALLQRTICARRSRSARSFLGRWTRGNESRRQRELHAAAIGLIDCQQQMNHEKWYIMSKETAYGSMGSKRLKSSAEWPSNAAAAVRLSEREVYI